MTDNTVIADHAASADQMTLQDARDVLHQLLDDVGNKEIEELHGLASAFCGLSDAAAAVMEETSMAR